MYFICCKILGVPPGADEATIRAAYRKSAKELHPDLNDSEKAAEYFIILNNAYEYLLTHRYTDAELQILRQQEKVKTRRAEKPSAPGTHARPYRSKVESYTLREVLKQSRTARILYLVFHVLFIFVGVWLLIHSIYDMAVEKPAEGVDPVSAYSTIFFGFVMGLIFTSTFLVTGISYLRSR